MAFQVEDGSGLSDANSYLALADFRAHHLDRGLDLSGEADADLQAALVQATDYIDKRFGRRFRGWRRSRSQALEWPRTDAYDDDDYTFPDVPVQLQKATAEYALLAFQLGRNLAPVPGTDFSIVDPTTGSVTTTPSGMMTSKSEEVGPIKESTAYSEANRPMVSTGNPLTQRIPEYPQADLWIEELIVSSSSGMIARG